MSYTVARVTPGGRPHNVVSAQKETITDVTSTGATEVVPARDLGLNVVEQARAESGTANVATTVDAYSSQVTLTAAPAAVTRVVARGK